MALSRSSLYADHGSPSPNTDPWTTGSFTPADNSLLIVCVAVTIANGTTDPADQITIDDDADLVWTSRRTVGQTGDGSSTWAYGMAVFTAPVTTGASMTVTVDCGVRTVSTYIVQVFNETGYNTTTPIGASGEASNTGSAAYNLTVSPETVTTSHVFGWTVHDGGSTGTHNATAGTGWTELYETNDGSDSYNLSLECQIKETGLVSTTVPWTDLQAGTQTVRTCCMAIEVQVAAAVATDQKTFRFFSAGDELPHYDTGTTPVIEAGDITHTNDTDADNSKAISYPAYANGDLIIMAIATDAAVTHTLPANGPNSETISIICEDQSPGAGGPTFSVFYYVATAAQGSPGTLTVTLSASETASCECIVVPAGEFDAAAPIDSNSGAGFQTSGTGETISMPAFSCVRAGGRLVVIGGVDTDPMDNPFSPAGYTDRAGAGRDDGSQNSFVATRDAATSAAESISAAAFGIDTGDTAACIGIVVNAPRTADGRTPFAAAGADVELEVDTDYGWQVRVESTGAATSEDTYKIQYKLNAGSWTDVTDASSVVKASATADFANGADVTEYLGGTGTYITNNNAALDTTGTLVLAAVLGASQAFEAHLNFQIVGADVADADTIQLRIVYEDGTALTSYTDTPTITVNKEAGGTLSFSPKPTAATATAAASMPVLRPLGPKPTGASSTSTAVSRALRPISASPTSATATSAATLKALLSFLFGATAASQTGAVSLPVLRPLSLSSTGASTTGAVSMPVLRPLSFGAEGASDTSAIELLTAAVIAFSMSISAVSETPDTVSMPVLRPLSFSSTAESTTAMVSTPVLRPLSASSTGASDTAEINLDVFIPGLVQFAATVIVQSETSAPSMPVLRALQFSGIAASDTASIVAAVARALSASITAASATGTPALSKLISFMTSMAANSATTSCAITILRALTVAASAGSLTSDAIAAVLRPLTASYPAATVTAAVALVTAGLGVIVSPEILSITARRILAAAGSGYEIESKTTHRTIH